MKLRDKTKPALRLRKLLLPVGLAGSALAIADVEVNLQAEIERQKNINRTASDQIDDDLYMYGGDLLWLESGQHLQSDFSYSFLRTTYAEDSFDDRDEINGRGYLYLFNSRQTLGWFAENVIQDTVLDVTGPATPANLNRVATTTTGPRINLFPSSRDRIGLSGSRSWVRTERESADSVSDLARFDWHHSLGARSAMGLELSYMETMPEAEDIEDYSLQRGLLNAERQLRYGEWSLAVGASNTDARRYDGEQIGTVGEARFNLNVETEARGRYRLFLSREIASTGLASSGDLSNTPAGDVEFSLEIITQAQAGFGIDLGRRFSYELLAERSEEDFQLRHNTITTDSLLNQLSMTLGANVFSFEYELINRDVESELGTSSQKEVDYRLIYRRAVTRELDVRCSYEQQVFDDDIRSSLAGCSVVYQLI